MHTLHPKNIRGVHHQSCVCVCVCVYTCMYMHVCVSSILAKAATIAIRYSAVRQQGFVNTREDSHASGEHSVLNYQVGPG